jgi:hypothetical protein
MSPLLRWLPEVVARTPATVRVKLLAAFLAIVGLLIVVGVVSPSPARQPASRGFCQTPTQIAAYRADPAQHDASNPQRGPALLVRMSDLTALRQLTKTGTT